jgi:hypothetical protein
LEIRPTGDNRPPDRRVQPASTQPATQGGPKPQAGDAFNRQEAEEDTPFWLMAMATDRLAGRQYLDARAHKLAAKAEARWIDELLVQARPVAKRFVLPALHGAQGLRAFQDFVDGIIPAGFAAPRVVWLPGMREGRGQYLFRVSGSLIQLRPEGPGDRGAWLETVAHEVFHHLQQELVTALYKGDEPVNAQLAAYYRDARAVYQPALPFEANRRQALEVGAWRFGERVRAG